MRVKTISFNLLCIVVQLPVSSVRAVDIFVASNSDNAKFGLATSHNKAFSVLCDEEEHKGVLTTIGNPQTDFQKVTSVRPDMVRSADETVRVTVGPCDKNLLIRQLLKAGKLGNDLLKDKNEKFIITTLHNLLKGLEGESCSLPEAISAVLFMGFMSFRVRQESHLGIDGRVFPQCIKMLPMSIGGKVRIH